MWQDIRQDINIRLLDIAGRGKIKVLPTPTINECLYCNSKIWQYKDIGFCELKETDHDNKETINGIDLLEKFIWIKEINQEPWYWRKCALNNYSKRRFGKILKRETDGVLFGKDLCAKCYQKKCINGKERDVSKVNIFFDRPDQTLYKQKGLFFEEKTIVGAKNLKFFEKRVPREYAEYIGSVLENCDVYCNIRYLSKRTRSLEEELGKTKTRFLNVDEVEIVQG